LNTLAVVILLLLLAVALPVVMSVAWYVQRATGNTGWIDVFWTFGLGAAGMIASLIPLESVWPGERQILVAVLVALWSLRLGWHILIRTQTIGDDPRYRQLIKEWGDDGDRQMFLQLQKQAAVSILLVLSITVAAHNPAPFWRLQDVLGFALLLMGILGETIADRQLRHFKTHSANRNAVCDVGLWHYSRHPNYFFEWICWLAYPIIAIDLMGGYGYGWIAVLAPICMYWALVYVSGIPPLEAHMLRTRGDAFRAYQRQTPAFFPFLAAFDPKL